MTSERARCAYHPKIVLREHFDDRPGPNGSIYTTPNGTFSCLRCDEERDRRAAGGVSDGDRLDWLEANRQSLFEWKGGPEGWTVRGDPRGRTYPTARAAIDAAMRREKEPTE